MKQQGCFVHCCIREQAGLSSWLGHTAAILISAHVGMCTSGLLLATQAPVWHILFTSIGLSCIIVLSLVFLQIPCGDVCVYVLPSMCTFVMPPYTKNTNTHDYPTEACCCFCYAQI